MIVGPHQREEFAARGVIRLGGLIPDATVARVRELALRTLEREGVWLDGAWVGGVPVDAALGRRLLRSLRLQAKRSEAYAKLVTADVLEAVTALVDGRLVSAARSRPQVLFTPPNATAWTVPRTIWHLDMPRLGEIGLAGVQMFSFLTPVAPRAGGTLVVAGSHRLLNDQGRIRSKDVKRQLKREPWFRELMGRRESERGHFLDEPGRAGDVALQVVELCGDPGDVYLMDMRVLHTLAPNASRMPRLMVTQRFVLESLLADLYGPSSPTSTPAAEAP